MMAKKKVAEPEKPIEEPAEVAAQAPADPAPPATQHGNGGNGEPKKPIQSYRLTIGTTTLEVAVWENRVKSQFGDEWVSVYSVGVQRSYRVDGGFSRGGSFRTAELPGLLYLLNKASDWIYCHKTEDSSIPW
jgi:hypothetical protein